MNQTEQKRLRELADRVMRSSTFGMDSAVERAIIAAIEPYRTLLADSRAMLSTVVEETGWTAADEHVKEIDALLGEE